MHYPETYLDEYERAFEKMTKTVNEFIQTHERETVMGKVKASYQELQINDNPNAEARLASALENLLEAESKTAAVTDVTTVLQERGSRYGRFVDQAELAQRLKQCVRNHRAGRDNDLTYDQQEALDMILHKIARIANGDPNYADSWIDIAGYAKLVSDRLEGVTR